MEANITTLSDYLAILRRRKYQLLVPALVVFVVAAAVAFLLPAIYRSKATILIEQQDIPPELVQSTVTGYADQRIQIISQRVMTSANLQAIIEKYDLYREERRSKAPEQVIEQMREDINLETVNAEVRDPSSGKPIDAVIAFTLSYDNKSPARAQQVANELSDLFLKENQRERTQKAAEASEFLTAEAERLEARITGLEEEMANFKEQNVGRLPELAQLNLKLLERTESELKEVLRRMRSLDEQRIYLKSELAQLNPNTQIVSASGERILTPAERLRALEAEYVSKKAVYGPNHPDLVKMRREIEALRKETGQRESAEEIERRLLGLRSDLAEARERYSAEHPDVKRLERAVTALERRLKDARKRSDSGAPETTLEPDNPAYIQLQAQLDAVTNELESLREQKQLLKAKLKELEDRLVETPQVERRYRALTREYENALAKYQEIRAKQMQAKLAEHLEKGQNAERFSLIEPPLLPQAPESPNRLAILFVGFVLSLGSGLGVVAISESIDGSVRGARGVAMVVGVPPLALIPRITNESDRRWKMMKRLLIFVAVLLAIAAALLAVHFLYKPLDDLWYIAQRRMGL